MTQRRLGIDLSTKHPRKRKFLEEMRRGVPPSELIALSEPPYPEGTRDAIFSMATMLQIHFLQQWSGLSDAAIEGLYDIPLYCDWICEARRDMTCSPDESTARTGNVIGTNEAETLRTAKKWMRPLMLDLWVLTRDARPVQCVGMSRCD